MTDKAHLELLSKLTKEFNSLAENHSHLAHSAVSHPESPHYALKFYASINPIGSELEHKKPATLETVDSWEKLNGELGLLVFLGEHGPEMVREYLDQHVYYDNLYFYTKNTISRCEIYHKDGTSKSISIQRLILDDTGKPTVMLEINQGSPLITTYRVSEEKMYVASCYPFEGAWKKHQNLTVSYLDEKILYIVDEKSGAHLYSLNDQDSDLDSLIDKYHNTALDLIISGLSDSPPEFKDVCGVVLEYMTESPFPPSIGLPTYGEREGKQYEDYALGWLNAAELHNFYECEFFSSNRDCETINARLRELEYEEVQTIAERFYIRLSKSITTSKDIRKILDTRADFFCTAHDYRYGTDLDILEKYVSKELLNACAMEIKRSEDADAKAVASNPNRAEAYRLLEIGSVKLPALVNAFNCGKYELRYGVYGQLSIRPISLEQGSFEINKDTATISPASLYNDYRIYHLNDGQLQAITYMSGSEAHQRTYFGQSEEGIEQIEVNLNTGEVVRYKFLEMRNGKAIKYVAVDEVIFNSETYEYEGDTISRITMLQDYIEFPTDPSQLDYLLTYNDAGALLEASSIQDKLDGSPKYTAEYRELAPLLDELLSLYTEASVKLVALSELEDNILLIFSPAAQYRFPFNVYIEGSDYRALAGERELKMGEKINRLNVRIIERSKYQDIKEQSHIEGLYEWLSERLTFSISMSIGQRVKIRFSSCAESRKPLPSVH
ncbi:hypothetical protein QWY82_08175 [Simiduia curdlanivorans]|uniref:Uncharacterized protein n=1 Tax=Simiduia curdlanivorans TaxID=1492769 RepID=A0ABV8V6W4_9GAMM|nr:hypothetical protein [Simiduia curdlanivorans]MDN3638781.1 hypothetical protein [Simiduia curdlanivorans]